MGTPGGGGFGDPPDRAADLVLRDVKREYYTAEQAQELFGVVLTGDLDAVDVTATATLRGR